MDWYYVDSSNIDAVAYDGSNLFVMFLDGREYEYFGVPWEHFTNLQTTETPGEYLHHYIKGIYPYQRHI